jgi:hypothetical protein
MVYLVLDHREESCNGFSVEIGVIGRQLKGKINSPVFRAENNGPDDRDSRMWVRGFCHWRLTAWGIGSAESRGKHESGFVNEYKAGVSVVCFGFNTRELFVFPSSNRILVPVSRLEMRFLEGPTEPLI